LPDNLDNWLVLYISIVLEISIEKAFKRYFGYYSKPLCNGTRETAKQRAARNERHRRYYHNVTKPRKEAIQG
jgi:hypothetical protein